jgi:hypothetical protein
MPAVKFGFFARPRPHPVLLPAPAAPHKAAYSGLRVVGISIKNDASQVDDTLESMKPFARNTQSMQLAVTPATAAECLTACATATEFGART